MRASQNYFVFKINNTFVLILMIFKENYLIIINKA